MVLTFILGLVVATAGTATAARLITGKQIKDGTISQKDLSKAVRAQLAKTGIPGPPGPTGDPGTLATGSITAEKLAEGSVGPAALQANAVGADQIFPGAVGSREVKDFSLEFSDFAAGAVAPRLFAHVSSSGALAENHGATGAGRASTGQYYVDFDRSLTGCVAVASVGFGFGPGVIGAGATVQPRMNLDNQKSRVGLTVYRNGYTFNDVADSDVSVIVMC